MQIHEKRKAFFSLFFPICFIFILWLIKLIEVQFELNFSQLGILPRELSGLKGILFSPLIHGDFSHLFNNSIPLFILGSSLFYFYRALAFKIVFWSWILAGLYTWISARYNYHIGASGLVYSLFGFILISGFLRKNSSLISISFLVAFIYGSLIWGILPWDYKVSWEGHFWGLLVGLILAFLYRKKGPQAKKYSWDVEDADEENEEEVNISNENSTESYKVEYHFKPKEKQ